MLELHARPATAPGAGDSAIAIEARVLAHAPAPDRRFEALCGAAAWSRLTPAIRRRFGRKPTGGAATYVGLIVESRRSRLGWLVAHACRAIGAPLPLEDLVGAPAIVSVTEDAGGRGQFWTRIYSRASGFPQVIHSRKGFAGPTGLEEYLGCGLGIALTVEAEVGALHFRSHHYFFALGRRRLRLPAWLEPGSLTVSHVDRGPAGFAFVLALRHRLWGELISQTGLFNERVSITPEEHSHD